MIFFRFNLTSLARSSSAMIKSISSDLKQQDIFVSKKYYQDRTHRMFGEGRGSAGERDTHVIGLSGATAQWEARTTGRRGGRCEQAALAAVNIDDRNQLRF